MRSTSFAVAFVATKLLAGVLAYPAVDLDDIPEDGIFSSPGYLLPANISADDIDEHADYMVLAEPLGADHTGSFVDILPDEVDVDELQIKPRDVNPFALESRATPDTKVYIGKTKVDYGCGGTISSVRDILGSAVYSLCKGGFCNAGSNYARQVTWMGNGSWRVKRWVTVNIEGKYEGDATLGNLHNAVKASVRSESVDFAWRRVSTADSTWGQWGESCKMIKFSNYIHFWKPRGKTIVDVQIRITLNKVESKSPAALSLAAGEATNGSNFGKYSKLSAYRDSQHPRRFR